jgi:hypothetical protein
VRVQGILLVEALHTVAASHPKTCGCDVCLAADGDPEAFGRAMANVQMKLLQRRGVDLDDLTPRQQMILARIESGAADCGLCGDFGAVNETTGEGVACLSCGRDRPMNGLA